MMTRGFTFTEAFWDNDIIGTSGWDTVCRRIKDGKKVSSDFAHFVKDRVKAESDYSKALQNLVRRADGREEIGVLGESWRNLKAQTEKISLLHDEAAVQFNTLLDEINKFNDEQSKLKKQTEEHVKKYIQSKKNEYQKTMSLKKSYEDKCKEFNNAEENLKTIKSSVTTKKNELEKAETKLQKNAESRENADTAYQSAIENLDAARKSWEREHSQACAVFEDMERKRIDVLRDLLWRVTNVESLACVKHDECAECVRKVLEHCDVDDEIQEFISRNKGQSKPPEPILYENYYGVMKPSRLSGRGPVPPLQQKHPTPVEGLYSSVDIQETSPVRF
ncbi:Proline-serine-threonine phosphatase-interacting protein 2 [Mactra antiquata]